MLASTVQRKAVPTINNRSLGESCRTCGRKSKSVFLSQPFTSMYDWLAYNLLSTVFYQALVVCDDLVKEDAVVCLLFYVTPRQLLALKA